MGLIHHTSEFYSELGQQWNVEIVAKTVSVSSSSTFNLDSNGFNLEYQRGEFTRLAGLMPSTLTFGFYVENSTQKSSLQTILGTAKGEYYVKIYRGSADNENFWWGGWIVSDYGLYENRPFPYKVVVRATDSLGETADKYNNATSIDGSFNTKDIRFPMQLFSNKNDLETVFPSRLLSFSINWWNDLAGTYDANVDPATVSFYNRAAFVTDPEVQGNIIRDFRDEISGVYKAFGARILLSDSKYRILQDNVLDNTYAAFEYRDTEDSNSVSGNYLKREAESFPTNTTIDNTADPSILGNATILGGSTYYFEPELNSVRVTFPHGDSGIIFDSSLTYSTLTTVGLIGGGSSNLRLTLNLNTQQVGPGPNTSSTVQPITNQGNAMCVRFNCQLKSGNKYLKGAANISSITSSNTSEISNFSWTETNTDIFVITAITHGSNNVLGTFSLTETGSSGETTYVSSMSVFKVIEIPQPPILEELEFKFTPTTIEYLNQVPDNPYTQTYDLATTTLLADWAINGATVNSSSQNINQINFSGSGVNAFYGCSIVVLDTNNEQTEGTTFYTSQNPNVNQPDLDLGNLNLGTPLGTFNNPNSNKFLYSSNSGIINGFAIGSSTNFVPSGQLLVSEYLNGANNPIEILQATIYSKLYDAHQTLTYQNNLGEGNKKFVMLNATFTAAKDTWSGEWYKLNLTTDNQINSNFVPPNLPLSNPDIDVPAPVPGSNNPSVGMLNLIQGNLITKLTTGIGSLTSESTLNNDTKLQVSSTTSKIYQNQKLLLTDSRGNNRTVIEAFSSANKNSSVIAIKAKTLNHIAYPAGSLISIMPSDLTNVITGGSGGGSGGSGVSTLNDLTLDAGTLSDRKFEVSTTPTLNDVIKWNGSKFVNATLNQTFTPSIGTFSVSISSTGFNVILNNDSSQMMGIPETTHISNATVVLTQNFSNTVESDLVSKELKVDPANGQTQSSVSNTAVSSSPIYSQANQNIHHTFTSLNFQYPKLNTDGFTWTTGNSDRQQVFQSITQFSSISNGNEQNKYRRIKYFNRHYLVASTKDGSTGNELTASDITNNYTFRGNVQGGTTGSNIGTTSFTLTATNQFFYYVVPRRILLSNTSDLTSNITQNNVSFLVGDATNTLATDLDWLDQGTQFTTEYNDGSSTNNIVNGIDNGTGFIEEYVILRARNGLNNSEGVSNFFIQVNY